MIMKGIYKKENGLNKLQVRYINASLSTKHIEADGVMQQNATKGKPFCKRREGKISIGFPIVDNDRFYNK